MLRLSAIAAGAGSILFSGTLALADPASVRPVIGAVIVARTNATDARLIWDATQFVTQLVSENLTDERGVHAIEATALRALTEKGKTLTAATLTVKVTYTKTGAVSPVYGNATFAGVEAVMTVGAKRAALAEHAEAWTAQLANGTIPDGVTVSVTGKLPPAH